MEVNQALREVENSVRNLILYKLEKTHGSGWVATCGVTAERIQMWTERKEEELKKLKTKDERLIYYADFYDLTTILKKHWSAHFEDVFGKRTKFESLWNILEAFRNPDAHRREFLPFQVNLILGASGSIRTDITRYFSNMDTGESYFPRIESVQDNLGNSWHHGGSIRNHVNTGLILRPGDILQFSISAFDPLGGDLLYSYSPSFVGPFEWTDKTTHSLTIRESHIAKSFYVHIRVKSTRDYHASGFDDDRVEFLYTVLPPILP